MHLRCLSFCALLLAFAGSGCVARRVMITSEPSHALVMIDGEEIGYTPTAVDFAYYATREVTLVKDGYERLTEMRDFSRPWYQTPPLNFVTDNFLFGRTTDRHSFHFRLQPKRSVPTEDLLNNANGLRSEALLGPVNPPSP